MRAAEVTREALLKRGDRPILHEMSGRSVSATEFLTAVERVAGKLLEAAPKDGIVGVWYRNSVEAVAAFLAVEWAGLTRITVDPHAQVAEAKATFEAGGAEFVLADREHAEMLDGAAAVHDRDAPFFGEPSAPRPDVDPGRPLSLYPRSVSAGKLFAIPFSYGNWDAILQTNVDLYRSGQFGPWRQDEEVLLAAQQIMHATGLVGTFPFLLMGRPQVLVDRFVAAPVIDAIDRFDATTTFLVPQMLMRLVEAGQAQPTAMPRLRHILYGGGPIEPDDIKRALRRFGQILSQIFGRMEGGWPISVLGPEEHAAIAAGDDRLVTSCGRPVEQVAVRLRPTAQGETNKGELLVASPMNVAEYTAADGYCSLGDIMEMDDSGYLFYRGRLDRMINTGYHVYPGEIEEIIAGVRGVARVLVAGESNRDWGQTVVAYVVPKPRTKRADLVDRIRAEVSGKLARYKVPREFRLVDRLPPQHDAR
jgi:acyl-CoA synthetase (AMP-forming)/AMP-acid ligase II